MIRKPFTLNLLLIVFGLILGLIILEGGLWIAARVILHLRDTDNPTPSDNRNQFTILCVGESTTYCGDRSYAYPRQLESILSEQYPGINFNVINKGKPGCNSAYIAGKLPEWLAEKQPDMVIAMMGINDSRERLAPYYAKGGEGRIWNRFRSYKALRFIVHNIGFTIRSLYRKIRWDAGDCIAEGMRLLEEGEDEEAARLFRRALTLDPGSAPAHVGLARYYYHRQNDKLVMRECARALELDPQNDRALTIMGRANMEQSRWGEAADRLEQAISINPANAEALGALSWCCYWKLKRPEEAETLALRALRIDPANHLANAALWNLYKKCGDWRQALEVCLQAQRADPLNDRIVAEIAFLYGLLGETGRSEHYSDKIASLRLSAVNPMTVDSYRKIKEMTRGDKITLVAVQYPMRSVEPLKKIVGNGDGVIVVDNERIFQEAVNRDGFGTYFQDNFGGNFGHGTAEGNGLLAANIVRRFGEAYFSADTSTRLKNNGI